MNTKLILFFIAVILSSSVSAAPFDPEYDAYLSPHSYRDNVSSHRHVAHDEIPVDDYDYDNVDVDEEDAEREDEDVPNRDNEVSASSSRQIESDDAYIPPRSERHFQTADEEEKYESDDDYIPLRSEKHLETADEEEQYGSDEYLKNADEEEQYDGEYDNVENSKIARRRKRFSTDDDE